MLIDWFTIIAQIFNFIILVLLLRKFLYRPILKVMQEREERIRSHLDDADEKQRQAQEQISLYQQKNQGWNEEREELLRDAKHEVENTRKQLMKKVRQDVEEHQSHWDQAVEREKIEFLDSLRKKISQQTFNAVRRVLNELANVELEAHISKVFIDRLKNMDENQVTDYREAIEKSDTDVLVRSAFSLPDQTREQIEAAARKQFLNSQPVKFEIDPELVCGIELRAAGYKLVWSIAEYLERLEDLFEEGVIVQMDE
ncbi:MAG: F0F1 ATP synthase subunit delta [Anaerolineaceae bacterium]|nr:F0F1 ATP synthase subunit delta [Anaerolineaceae bacterium]